VEVNISVVLNNRQKLTNMSQKRNDGHLFMVHRTPASRSNTGYVFWLVLENLCMHWVISCRHTLVPMLFHVPRCSWTSHSQSKITIISKQNL